MDDKLLTYLSLILTIVGWVIIVTLNIRTINRSELSRQRTDKLALVYKLIDYLQTTQFSLQLEEFVSAQVSQIEIRFNNTNKFVNFELLSSNLLSQIEFVPPKNGNDYDPPKYNGRLIILLYDVAENIELAYSDYYKKYNYLERFYLKYKDTLHGSCFGFIILMVLKFLFN
jgi:hypothetical protein